MAKKNSKKTGNSKRGKSSRPSPKISIRRISRKELSQRLAKQAEQAKVERRQAAADKAVKSYRAKKGDRGKIVFIGLKGQSNPQSKGRKGYPIYVTKTGKKQLLKYKGTIKPEKINNVKLPFQKKLRKARENFQSSRLVSIKRGKASRPVSRGNGRANTGKTPNDFNNRVVKSITTSVEQSLSKVKSHRIFVVRVNALVQLPDSTTKVYTFSVGIERPDHIAIKRGGVENWVRKKFYAEMANQLRFDGYVSSGSANHIRRLQENYGVGKKNWTQDGEDWRGQDLEIAKILTLEWDIQQAQ